MPTGRSWWHPIRYGFRLCRHGCPCKLQWFSFKQWSNYSTLCPAGPVLRTFVFVQYLMAFCSRPKAASYVISGRCVMRPVVLDKCKISWSVLKPFSRNSTRSRRRRYFRQLFCYSFRPEVDNEAKVISGVAADYGGMDVHVKFCDSRSNGFLDIRGIDFVSNEWKIERKWSKRIPIVNKKPTEWCVQAKYRGT